MKCIRCNKPLKAFAKQVTVADGSIEGWGPRCARLAFATKRRQPAVKPAAKARHRTATPTADYTQIDWVNLAWVAA